MARGLKKHLKRLNAPKHWMLDKLGGTQAIVWTNKSRECLPLILILRNRLKYALTYREMLYPFPRQMRTSVSYMTQRADSDSNSIRDEEAKFKLCKVKGVQFGQKGIPYLNTYDGRTIRYPDPLIKANDTVKLDLESNKIVDFIKFDVGNVVMVTGGRTEAELESSRAGRSIRGPLKTIHVQDATGHEFATRLGNVFTIGKGTKPWVTLPKGKGIKLSHH
ncbi:40S ribosomal protein S4 [Vitis vinifera]|uniref:40S ribosomal protein S4 n=1 Tax=Vitis vinifera TaxID=29760 RepID=A0A438GWC8_VITVI|nr:40S ribosomal protein S4 [Vitis vinifera]